MTAETLGGPGTQATRVTGSPSPIVTRSRRPATWAGLIGIALLVVLALLPYVVYESFTNTLVNLFILMTIATMWNALAGYAGLVSVGQQAYIGVGAYAVLVAAQHGIEPFVAIPIAVAVAVACAVPASWLVFRLAGAYFAIATWVLAVVADLAVTRYSSLGGGTGAPLPGLSGIGSTVLSADTYWGALVIAVLALVSVFLLLRSRLGLVLTAVRDNEVGARSVGSRVTAAKRAVYLLAAGGCAAAGALIAISQLNVEPSNVFNVQWSAYMIFAVLIGGLGTIEGPIIGSIVFIVLQQTLAQYNAWYLIILGAVAMVIAIWARRGLWGLLTTKVPLHLFPVGYHLHLDDGVTERHGPLRLLLGPARIPRGAPASKKSSQRADESERVPTSSPPESEGGMR
jgi:branched-chain amino acid transport system permease protein